jgi:transposase
MLMLPSSVRVYVASEPADLRKSFDGLSVLVAQHLGQDPLSGHLYVFFNRRADQVRILFWDRTGFALFAKKLARGRFHFVRSSVKMESAELGLLLEGINLAGAKRSKRWRAPKAGSESMPRIDHNTLVVAAHHGMQRPP